MQHRQDLQEGPRPTGTNDLLTLGEVRAHCRIGRTTLWRWMNEHNLRTDSVLRIKRVRRRDLEAFLERHAKTGLAAGREHDLQ